MDVFFGYIAKWWFVSVIIGLLAFPITFVLFGKSQDKGYMFTKIVGIFLISYFSWLLGFLSFSTGTILGVIAVMTGVSVWLFLQNKKEMLQFFSEKAGVVIIAELFYFLIFLVYAMFRMNQPDIVGTEKFMDFAFINSIVKADKMPPFDPWMYGVDAAGKALHISYYYFGYLMMAIMFKLTAIPNGMAYNIALTYIVALSALGTVGLLYNLTKNYLIGFLAAAFLLLISNIDGFIQVVSNGWSTDNFNWWHTSRIIDRPNYDITINEFPFFSFLLGDLHPHQMAIPFVLLALNIGLLFAKWEEKDIFGKEPRKLLFLGFTGLLLGGLWFLNSWDFPTYLFVIMLCIAANRYSDREKVKDWWVDAATGFGVIFFISIIAYLPFTLLFGSQAKGVGFVKANTSVADYLTIFGIMLFPILSFIVFRTFNWVFAIKGEKSKKRNEYCPRCGTEIREGKIICGQCGYQITGVELKLGGEELPVKKGNQTVMSFFKLFTAPGSVKDKKVFIGLGITIGVALLLITVKTIFDLTAKCPECKGFTPGIFAGIMFLLFAYTFVLGLTKVEQKENQFVIILIFTAFFAALGCELFHVIDTFSREGQHAPLERMNTVFKFYYQTWIMYSIAAAYSFFWIKHFYLRHKHAAIRWSWYSVFILLIAAGMFYPFAASSVKTAGFSGAMELDGSAFLKERLYEGRMPAAGDYEAIQWLKKEVKGKPVILEAWGGEYTEYARITSFTGLPTVLGWPGHELQWRGNYDEAGRRQGIVSRIYETADANEAQQLLNQFNVEYVYVGVLERDKFGSAGNLDKFKDFMDVAYFNKNETIIYKKR
ncbi:MAG: hypothetical protein CVV21_03240 [Candidatus Goldiibacteriota bacterium HGW-Goldbacteria-1]|nr:MAG: hypothetical protein CVV21_03240 [Candidatus Goldiibacteriota bacterium HGW-Goldbacteria-1]